MKHLKYARYVFTHKFWVGVYCFREGLLWRGLVHDLSKFRPSEWIPYANFFGVPEENRTSVQKAAFTLAWMRHWHLNDHHWQYWIRISDNGEVKALEMPDKARREMICDWKGVQKTLGKTDLAGWYKERESGIKLGPKTKAWVKETLGVK